ncbi:MAG: TetR/AcrR family transcriptional regulator [Chloroflexi bacterium]|nr:TetR/AcrR family transcriptional regulator [Chloroflexota bacterium]
MATPSGVEASNTRDRILDAAVEVIAERGYSAAGVQEIIDRAGTSKGSFYFHFPSKETMTMALLEQMSNRLIKRVQEAVQGEPTPLHRVAAGIEFLLATFSRHRKVAQVLLVNLMGHGRTIDRRFLPIREKLSELIKGELDAAVAQGQIECQDTSLVAAVWVGALHEVIMRWLLTGQPSPLSGVAPELRSTLLRSVGVDPAMFQPLQRRA